MQANSEGMTGNWEENISIGSDKQVFSVALQIKIKDSAVIAELKQRMEAIYQHLDHQEYGDICENPGNFRITIRAFFPRSDQIKAVIKVFRCIVDTWKSTTSIATLTDQNAVFGLGEKKYPVALIECNTLKELYENLTEQLARVEIKCARAPEEFSPHVSLFVDGISHLNEEVVKKDCQRNKKEFAINFYPNIQWSDLKLSYQNAQNQFVPLAIDDLNALHDELARQGKIAQPQPQPVEVDTGPLYFIEQAIGKARNKKFEASLIKLKEHLQAKLDKNPDDDETETVVRQQSEKAHTLVEMVYDEKSTDEAKLGYIDYYIQSAKRSSHWHTGGKVIAAVAITATFVVLGAVIGAGIGIGAGIWSGPGAALTGLAGLLKGVATGWSIGVAMGAVTTGTTAAAVSSYFFFRLNTEQRIIREVAKNAKDEVNPQQPQQP